MINRKIRIGVFGAARGLTMIRVLANHPDAELVAICLSVPNGIAVVVAIIFTVRRIHLTLIHVVAAVILNEFGFQLQY